ncbi:Hemoglobin subunit alpha-D [Merluccius polli]|uniref:Hemoglobin subunit alpha-D n=1 Tax=Merluccius polli TaxID=89951 RepID=A0AA47M7C8_MERPO|nr:Hemoglobin subunit alpha-D [Merluccius polli]
MLSKKEKELIVEIWTGLTPVADTIGAEALLRMLTSFPGTKTYFAHLDITPRSAYLLAHGRKIVLALADASKDMGNLMTNLGPLQTYHAYQLRIHPTNFKLLSYCMLVTLACYMGRKFTPVSHAAMDKYLSAISAVLGEKFR